jgi:hypothetical protein
LLKGQSTTLTVMVEGLAGLDQDVPLELVNHSPGIISMGGGNEQNVVIHHSSDLGANGSYTTTRTLTGIMHGGFNITATVHWNDTCAGEPK